MLLKNCRYVVTQNDNRDILENVDIKIEDGRITRIGTVEGEGTDCIDCSERIVMPGLMNCHTHLGITHLRGVSDDAELHEWLTEVNRREKEFTDADIERGNYLGITESLRSGTTSVVDMFFKEHLAEKAAVDLGVRLFCGNSILLEHPLAENDVRVPNPSHPRVTYCLCPHAIYTTNEELLRRVRDVAQESGTRIMIHLSETRKERADCKRERGVLPVEYLYRVGLLGPSVLLVHCNWLTKGEMDLIAKHDTKVVHWPQSNMKLAGGSCMPVRELLQRGVIVALGTDSSASNNSLDLFREMHVAALLHKHHYWDPTVTGAQDLLDMATRNGAVVLGRDDLGMVQEGTTADLITLDLRDVNLQPHSRERVVSHLVYAANGQNVSEVIVDGRLLIKDKTYERTYEPD